MPCDDLPAGDKKKQTQTELSDKSDDISDKEK